MVIKPTANFLVFQNSHWILSKVLVQRSDNEWVMLM